MGARCSSLVYYFLFEYETPKIVHLKSKTVGVINRLIQLTIIAYIIGYVLVYNKGYQTTSTLQSSVTSKVKGAVYTKHPFPVENINSAALKSYDRVWDVADYVVPAQENGAFFVMTNAIITPYQTQGKTATVPGNDTNCHNDTDCQEGKISADGNGVMTGKCVNYSNTEITTCEVYAWIPLEVDKLEPPYDKSPLLNGTEEFTVLIKNTVQFTLWPKLKTRNIIDKTNNKTYLQSCTYDSDNPFCPIFKLKSIVEDSGEDYNKLATGGGVMGIIIHWDCNLDFNVKDCVPKYIFRRLDDPEAKIAAGWNFRYAHFYNDTTRTLYKAYGILFMILVEGQGGKFDIKPLILNIASGLALLSIAVVVCDIIVLYVVRKRDYYRENKYQIVNDESQLTNHDELQNEHEKEEDSPPRHRTVYGTEND